MPCTSEAPCSTAASEFATPHSASLWVWMPTRSPPKLARRRARVASATCARQARAVRVAQRDVLGARVERRRRGSAARSRGRRGTRRRSARRRRSRACPATTRKATESRISSRFSSGSVWITFSRCSFQVLPTSVQTGAKRLGQQRAAPGRRRPARSRRRVMPKAQICGVLEALAPRAARRAPPPSGWSSGSRPR